MYFNSTHHCLSSSNWGRLLAPVSCYEDLMKPIMCEVQDLVIICGLHGVCLKIGGARFRT